ncbi:MAG: hypothetical protein WAT29_09470 [Thiolinea sp.]
MTAFSKKLTLIKKMLYSLKQGDFVFKKYPTDVLLFGDDSRNIKLGEKYYQPLMDSIRDDLESSGLACLYLDTPFSLQNLKNAWGVSGTINRGYFLSWLYDLIFFSGKKHRIKFYANIITSTEAKFIFMFNAPKPLCIAAYNNRIPCIELLHGIGYIPPIPWGWEKRSSQELPTHILSLDEESTQTFSTLENKGTKVIQIEHPFVKRFLIEDLHKKLPQEWLELFNSKNRKIILISLQWGYSGDSSKFTGILKNGILYEAFEDIIKQTKNNIFWGFRLHPVQLDSIRYKKHFNYIKELVEKHENTDWEWFTYKPLPTVLKNCDGHITMISMSAYEAAYMGVNTLALCPTLQRGEIHQDMFSDLEKSGYLKKALVNTEGIIKWTESVTKTSSLLKIQDDSAWVKFLSSLKPNKDT